MFVFYRILKLLGHMYQGMFHEQEFRIFHPLFWIWSHMGSQDVNINFLLHYYSM